MSDSVTTLLLGTIIGVIFENMLNYRSSNKLYKEQQLNELKNIAKAIDVSLAEYFNSEFNTYAEDYKVEKELKLKKPSVTCMFCPIFPLYSVEDPYFVFKHDISKFEHILAADIYQFYNDLIKAEAYRLFIVRNITKEILESGDSPPTVRNAHEEMKAKMISCSDKLPGIRTQLKKIYEE